MAEEGHVQTESVSVLELACFIFQAYVRHNALSMSDVPAALRTLHGALQDLTAPPATVPAERKPVVPVKRSVTGGYVICLEDGRKLKVLKRHLRTRHGLTPEEYRAKWQLPSDYPMTASEYVAQCSVLAKKAGLGRRSVPPPKRRT